MAPNEPVPNPNLLTGPPDAAELRGMRAIVRDKLEGDVLPDQHSGRFTRMRVEKGRFRSVNIALVSCEHDAVLCDIPVEGSPEPVRVCLICDAGRELLGLNGKPLS